jgi:AraC-like DNA-binding protein
VLSEAEFLLLGTDMPVKAIGFELGFSSGDNLRRIFLGIVGLRLLGSERLVRLVGMLVMVRFNHSYFFWLEVSKFRVNRR